MDDYITLILNIITIILQFFNINHAKSNFNNMH